MSQATRLFAGAFVLLSMSLVGCGHDDSPPSSDLVVFDLSGGIAGYADRLTINRDGRAVITPLAGEARTRHLKLSPPKLRRLKSLIADADLPSLKSDYSDGAAPDELEFTIAASGSAVKAEQSAVPRQLEPLTGFLTRLATAAPPTAVDSSRHE
jgi:hypothetical protein